MSDIALLYDLLKVTLPLIILFIAFWLMMKRMAKREDDLATLELRKQNRKEIVSLQLQAYERLVLFLERISPESLIIRLQPDNKSLREYQMQLIESIRTEYEHNLAQQLYVSEKNWEAVRMAKESMVKLINSEAEELGKAAKGIDLARNVIESYHDLESTPIHEAIRQLKKDLRRNF
ncbi:hypothetical protein EYV94_04820 [Puteibacter caeruleilacunae]|nr:hypothetical protein EYV94_04820 [Puteibacter caeruleilacunae]